jgi:hypothetical protein
MTSDHMRSVLDAHGVYLSDGDEAEITRRQLETDDVGRLALRTCLCGARIDGFDAYWDHLSEAMTSEVSTT